MPQLYLHPLPLYLGPVHQCLFIIVPLLLAIGIRDHVVLKEKELLAVYRDKSVCKLKNTQVRTRIIHVREKPLHGRLSIGITRRS